MNTYWTVFFWTSAIAAPLVLLGATMGHLEPLVAWAVAATIYLMGGALGEWLWRRSHRV